MANASGVIRSVAAMQVTAVARKLAVVRCSVVRCSMVQLRTFPKRGLLLGCLVAGSLACGGAQRGGGHHSPDKEFSMGSSVIVGALSGQPVRLADVNKAPMPGLAPSGMVKDGEPFSDLVIVRTPGQPDARSFRRKFGLLIPATNTSMEHELWSIIFNNPGATGLDGVGIHTVSIQTPKAQLKTAADLQAYKTQFVAGLANAIDQAALAQPEYLIMGMSLEHILTGVDEIRSLMQGIESRYPYSWATWHEAANAALKKYKAKRIALISPFDVNGNKNAIRLFEDLGYDVVASFGFACSNALDIAHIPDAAKEEVILRLLATPENHLDAVVQLGTNMSMLNVTEKLEPRLGIPILGINAVTFWYALRETGIAAPLQRGGRLLREF